jgi:hypothetical protein
MTEKSLMPFDADAGEETEMPDVVAVIAAEARSISKLAVDRRARLALELAAFAVEHVGVGGPDALDLGRRLRTVADTCTEATMLSHGLIDRSEA